MKRCPKCLKRAEAEGEQVRLLFDLVRPEFCEDPKHVPVSPPTPVEYNGEKLAQKTPVAYSPNGPVDTIDESGR